jgi:signal transduction histidine kinase
MAINGLLKQMTVKRRIFFSNIRMALLSLTGFASVMLLIRVIFSIFAEIQGNGSTIELIMANRGIAILLVFILFTILISVINNVFTYRLTMAIIQPLEPLIEGVWQIHDNNFAYRIDYQKNDEFRPVCEAFNEMAAKLEASVAQRLKDETSRRELIAGISHDLRTPLTLIKGYLEGIETGTASTPEILKKYFTTIKKRTEDIERISEQLFLFSKLDMNEFTLAMRRVDIFRAISDMIEEVIEEYALRGLAIQLVKTSENLFILADPLWLRNVVINILENSVNYKIREKAKMQIDASIDDNFAVLRFSDDGPGVNNEAIPKLFDAFYRTDPSRNKKGSGLGLAISAKIIEHMDGGIFAEPSSLGGLAVVIRLPLLQGDDTK